MFNCPNCESEMNEGETCPECEHDDRVGMECQCSACMEPDEESEDFDYDGGDYDDDSTI